MSQPEDPADLADEEEDGGAITPPDAPNDDDDGEEGWDEPGEAAFPSSPGGGSVKLLAGPIGNLGDITLRALQVLRDCHAVACEDTRRTRVLLERHGIPHKSLLSLHDHNEAHRAAEVASRAQRGEVIAVLSDAGMPTVSDPGFRLVRHCIAVGVPIEVLPGPSAVLTALAGSGLPTDAFFFGGFLPHKSGKKERLLQRALDREETSIFFESPHRIVKTLGQLAGLAPDRPVCVARELTKRHETWHRGTAQSLSEAFAGRTVKGEITMVIAGAKS